MSLLLAMVVACASETPSTSPTLGTHGLQTLSPGPMPTCAGVGIARAVIRGDSTLADPVWLELDGNGDGRRISTVWPFGYSARFLPALEIVSPTGVVIAREGTVVTDVGLCGLANDRFMLERIGEFSVMPTP
jgi:hypothetical protein